MKLRYVPSFVTYLDRNYLAHHGIKGQKWGVRRFRNYDGTLTEEGKERYGYGPGRKRDPKAIVEELSSRNVKEIADPKRIFTGKQAAESKMKYYIRLEDGTEVEISEEAVAELKKMAPGKVKEIDEVEEDREAAMRDLEKLKKNRPIKSFSKCPRMDYEMSADLNVLFANMDYEDNEAASVNCPFCTTAMALRERGYQVTARSDYAGGMPKDFFEKAFNSKTVEMGNVKSGEDMLRELGKNGDGAYGNLAIDWSLGGAHSVFWKNENGKTRIYDGQIGVEYTSSKEFFEAFADAIDFSYVDSPIYNRFDNCEPTEYALAAVRPSYI